MWFYKGFYIQELNATLNDFITVLAVFNSLEFHPVSIDVKRNSNYISTNSNRILIRLYLISKGILIEFQLILTGL